ncbi:hypothetical protein [Carboxylicivirga linearis]|uniref:Uncharacterized protein n=1 Tax=Carboxylicivirga linearis TaxID=1628157 RepID=A0ABS5K1L8_9BACT|nr:hypothetical protein [Carboxylicivirga linearis]MBS2101058.1 hypothetical protein [Carboxylicivirga linearis]
MNKIVKYGLLTTLILLVGLVISFVIFISSFDMFGEPEKQIIETVYDNEGLRQATIFEFGGNAVTNSSIHVSIDLGNKNKTEDLKTKIVFSTEHISGTTVKTEWVSFDTLKISYSHELEPITQIEQVNYTDSTLDVIIIYEK